MEAAGSIAPAALFLHPGSVRDNASTVAALAFGGTIAQRLPLTSSR